MLPPTSGVKSRQSMEESGTDAWKGTAELGTLSERIKVRRKVKNSEGPF
jgi:hypothetical protein